MNNVKPLIILEPVGIRSAGLHVDNSVSVLQVPAGEEEGLGGLSNLLKGEDVEESKLDDDDQNDMVLKKEIFLFAKDIQCLPSQETNQLTLEASCCG